ncbi:hypothetical protein HDU88_000734 [Geranomyces variabilis]|nr:hypothetical protein HDU88_000734 [Geranomyces variabilis]
MSSGHLQLPATDPAPLDPLAGDRMSDDQFSAWLKETSQNEEASSWTTPPSRRKAGAEHVKPAAPATAQAPSTPPARFPSLSSGDLPTAPAKKQKRMSSRESVKAHASNTAPAKRTAAAKTATPTSKSGRTSNKTSLPTPAPTPAHRSRKSSNARSPSLSPTPPQRAAASNKQAKGKKRAYIVISSDSEDEGVPSSSAGGSRSSDKGRPAAVSSSTERAAAKPGSTRSKGLHPLDDADSDEPSASSTYLSKVLRISKNMLGRPPASATPESRKNKGKDYVRPEDQDESDSSSAAAGSERTSHPAGGKRGEAISTGIHLVRALEAEDLAGAIYRREHTDGETTLEIAFPGGAIMRRSDGWVNVTKLFTVLLGSTNRAANSWASRQPYKVDSVSKRSLTGKWISAEAAFDFAEQRSITDEIAPLLAVDMRPGIISSFSTKEELLAELPGGGKNAKRIKKRDLEHARLGSQKYRDGKKQKRN